MTSINDANEWPSSWTQLVGREVARVRREAGMSAQALADTCASVGYPVQRGTIAKLENGRREGINVHEVVVIAAALHVAPADLLFPRHDPFGEEAQVEYLPRRTVSTATAADNFHGDRKGSTRLIGASVAVDRAKALLDELREEQCEAEKRLTRARQSQKDS